MQSGSAAAGAFVSGSTCCNPPSLGWWWETWRKRHTVTPSLLPGGQIGFASNVVVGVRHFPGLRGDLCRQASSSVGLHWVRIRLSSDSMRGADDCLPAGWKKCRSTRVRNYSIHKKVTHLCFHVFRCNQGYEARIVRFVQQPESRENDHPDRSVFLALIFTSGARRSKARVTFETVLWLKC